MITAERLISIHGMSVARKHLAYRYPNVVAALDARARIERRRMLAHRSRHPPLSVVIPDATPSADDVASADRLLRAYRTALASSPHPNPERADLWTLIVALEQQDFVALLAKDDPEQLAAYLCNVSRHSAAHGIAQGHREYARLQRDRLYRDFLVRLAHEKLILLAEAVGAIAPDNPEQGERGRGARCPPDDLIAGIEKRLGLTIAPPNVDGAMLKLCTVRGLFGERDLHSIYTAHLLRQQLGNDGTRASVCEIGGGTGRVAYWARRMGMRSYTIVDLPLVNVVQGFYALRTMPPDGVVLYGERPPSEPADYLQILPPQAVQELGDASFDLFLNQDSMPEMSTEIAESYLSWIAHACRRYFVSINHETKPAYGDGLVHLNVAEIAGRSDSLRLVSRSLYWLRRGYVVETYEPSGHSDR